MGESLLELRGEYENFLRGEVRLLDDDSSLQTERDHRQLMINQSNHCPCLQRYNLTERIATAIDDFQHIKSDGICPRITLSMAELRSEGFSERLRLDPLRHLRALEAACHLIALEEKPGYDEDGTSVCFITSFNTKTHSCLCCRKYAQSCLDGSARCNTR